MIDVHSNPTAMMVGKSWLYHPTCVIDKGVSADIGEGTTIHHFTHICGSAKIGKNCMIGQGCYIGPNVVIGDNVRIQNNVSVYEGVTIEDDCFIGPSVVFTNCHLPVPGTKGKIDKTLIRCDSMIGANATIIAPCTLEVGSVVGAGAVVTSGRYGGNAEEPLIGNPARLR